MNQPKVAIVHDWLTNFGGAERVVKNLAEMFPEAPIYTLVYNKENMAGEFPEERVRTSFLQKVPLAEKYYTKMLPLMPRAFESFDLNDYDLVLSSSSSCAKGVLTGPDTLHISYIHTPMRYAWDLYFDYYKSAGFLSRMFIKLFIPRIRQWDLYNTFRIDYLIGNSNFVKRRIKKYYRREAEVIFPPVNTEFFVPGKDVKEDYYLAVSRFVPYKRIDLAIKACNELNRKLVVIGSGSEENYLKSIAGPTIEFTGRVDDATLREYYRQCKALIFNAKEDFGIIPLEVQACGRPVIAFGQGGALDTVVDGKTGVLYRRQDVESVKNAILDFEKMEFESEVIRKHAEKFSVARFKKEMMEFIQDKYNRFNEERRGNSSWK